MGIMALALQTCILQTLYLAHVLAQTSSSVTSSGFAIATHCIDLTCTGQQTRVTRSQVECASVCLMDHTCAGFQFERSGVCLLVQSQCLRTLSCSSSDTEVPTFEKQKFLVCQNGGVWDVRLKRCQCVKGWAGIECERNFYLDCQELLIAGYADGIHWVPLAPLHNSTFPPLVKCELKGSTVYTYVFQNTGRSNHTKSWVDFISGYSDDGDNFWMGLDYMSRYNSRGHENVIVMVVLRLASRETILWHKYAGFRMLGNADGYRFTTEASKMGRIGVQNVTGSTLLGDVLGMSQGQQFLAPDRDSAGGCAHKAQTGWWFPNCSHTISVNPLGRLQVTGDGQLRLPGLDITDPSLQNALEKVGMAFVNGY